MALKTLDRTLRYFICIAELGSLSKAADVLDQTQSGLSKQLGLLERYLNTQLFTRTGRGLELTEAGSRLYTTSRPAFETIDGVVDQVRHQSGMHGTVRLATVHTLNYYFTAHAVATFVATRPHANLSLVSRSSPEVVEQVGVGKADLGFVYDVAVDLSNITSEPLFKEDMSLVVHKDSPVTSYESAEAAGLRLVAFPPHYALRRMLHSSGINATYVAEVDTVDGMLQLVSTGVGDCILPSKLPCKLLSDYGLRKCPANNPALNRWVVAISRLDKPLPLLAKSFLDSAIQISQEFKN